MIYVIGSGPSGVACANALLARGPMLLCWMQGLILSLNIVG